VLASRPAVVVKVTGTPATRLPFSSVTRATTCTVPPVDGTTLGLAVSTMVEAAAPPIWTSTFSEIGSPESAPTVARPERFPAFSLTRTLPFSVRASRGETVPSVVVNVTSVPFCTAVPLCSMTVAMISAMPLIGKTSGEMARVMADCVGARSGTVLQAAPGPRTAAAMTATSTARRHGEVSVLDLIEPEGDDIGMTGGGQAARRAVRGESRARHRDGRGARLAGRDDREYREYSRKEQHRQPGWIARRMPWDLHHGLLADARGYAMAALLVSLAVMSVMLTVALPVWRQAMQREREAELVFRGEQYARAVALFQRKFAGAFPPSIELLVDQKFLRQEYADPMVEDGEFQVLYQTTAVPGATPGTGLPGSSEAGGAGARGGSSAPPNAFSSSSSSAFDTGEGGVRGGVVGVVSKSEAESLRLYQGRSRYNEWVFLYTNVSGQAGAGAAGAAGQVGPGTEGAGGGRRPGVGNGGRGGSGQAPGGRRPGQSSGIGRPGAGPAPPGGQRPSLPRSPR